MDRDYVGEIRSALDGNETIIIGCQCEVFYFGKVESSLSKGDRLIIIKADKTLLVHQPEGVNPINYMKDGTEHLVMNEIIDGNKHLVMRSKHLFLKDYMDIIIHNVHFLESHKMEDGSKIEVSGSEADMSDMLYNNPNMVGKWFKPFSREEHNKFGYVDVFGTDDKGRIVVIECKRDNADFKAVSQLHRYVHKIMKSKGIKEEDIRGIIAAPRISANALEMLKEHKFEYISVNPPKYLERYDKNQKRLGEY